MGTPAVTLQINITPGDLRHVRRILPHQLTVLAGQVNEILFTLDTRQSRAFRAATEGYTDRLSELRQLLHRVCADFPQARIVEVDYSPTKIAEVGEAFLASNVVPLKACDGSAFYAYLFGIFSARFDHVFHIDSDMLFGGASQSWVTEAVEILGAHSDILACFPFPGPPKPDLTAPSRRLTSLWSDVTFKQRCVPSSLQVAAYSYNEVTTRAYILNRKRFIEGDVTIPLILPRLRRRLKSFFLNTPPYLLLEDCLTVLMNLAGLRSVSFLGSAPGLWSLHPRWRSEALYAQLGELIDRVENDNIPEDQLGDFDMNDSMIDWSEVYQRSKLWHRVSRNTRLAALGLLDRFQRNP
jgi:hypothetical protein